MKRNLEIVVLSDLHLGTFGCHANEILDYLKGIKPKVMVLNGDIIDIWQFKKSYFPQSHLQVISKILKMASNGTEVYYITGNHDERLRDFTDLNFANIHLYDQLELMVDGKKIWFFHGDFFDVSINYSKLFAKLGALGYDTLIRLNYIINKWSKYFGFERVSFSKKIKYSVKEAVKFIQNFEDLAVNYASKKGFDAVVCGHIHRPIIKEIVQNDKKITYMNSGDWIENLTSLEYNHGKWTIYEYENDIHNITNPRLTVPETKKIKNYENMLGSPSVAAILWPYPNLI